MVQNKIYIKDLTRVSQNDIMKFKNHQMDLSNPNSKSNSKKSIKIELDDLPNDSTRTAAVFSKPALLNNRNSKLSAKIVLLGETGSGKSYTSFSLKYNLYNLSEEETIKKLKEISNDLSISQIDRDTSLSLLNNLK